MRQRLLEMERKNLIGKLITLIHASGIGDLHRDCGRQRDAAEEVPDLPDRGTGGTLWCDTYPAVSEE